jgi:signal transduction histidine kinase
LETAGEQECTVEEFRRRERRKDVFLTVLAHELRSPLAPIASALEVLTIHQQQDQAVAQAHAIIRRQLYRLGRLIEDLHDVGCIVRGSVGMRMQPTDLSTVIAESIETVRPMIEVNAHKLKTELPPTRIMVHADPVRLGQVLVNVLTNAVKYTDPGGAITVALCQAECCACLRIQDTGIGIDPGALPGIFDMFAREDSSAQPGRGGLGIGLALARQIVELHGGRISARSEGRGRGSEFVIRLPLQPKAGS